MDDFAIVCFEHVAVSIKRLHMAQQFMIVANVNEHLHRITRQNTFYLCIILHCLVEDGKRTLCEFFFLILYYGLYRIPIHHEMNARHSHSSIKKTESES